MATNPSIILGYHPADVPDPLETRIRQGQLASLAGAQQLQQQQLVGAQQENQIRQTDINDQDALRKAWIDAGGDIEKTKQNAVKYGASPKALLGLDSTILDRKTKLSALRKEDLANQQTTNDQLSGLLDPVVKETDPVKQQAAWNTATQTAVARSLMTSEEAAQHPYPGVDGVKEYVAGFKTHDQLIKEVTANAAQTRANAAQQTSDREKGQTDFANAISALAAAPPKDVDGFVQAVGQQKPDIARRIFQAIPPSQYDPQKSVAALRRLAMSPEQQTQADQAAANAAATAARDKQNAQHQTNDEAIGRARLGIAQQELALKNKQAVADSDPYGALTDSMKPVADKLAFGDMSLQQISRFPQGVKTALTAAAVQRNPAWTAATFDTKQNFLNTSKTEGQALQGFGRLAEHIQRFEKNSTAIGIAPAYAMGMNLTGNQNALNEDAHAIAAELEKRLAGGVGSEGQTKAWIAGLRSPDPDARQKAIDEIGQIAGAQLAQMNQGYKASVGEDLPLNRFTTPATRDWLTRKGINVKGAVESPVAGPSGAAPAATSALKIGQVVKLKNGKAFKVTAVHPDGTFDAN